MPLLPRAFGPPEIDDNGVIHGWYNDAYLGRGTMKILWGCILTLTLCVWSALHLNIPSRRESKRKYWSRVGRWLFVGILIPEVVLWSAWRQWSSARLLTNEVNKILKEEDDQIEKSDTDASKKSAAKRKHKWTALHSFYVCMGGFVFDMEDSTEEDMDFIHNQKRLTLTPAAAILLAKCGHLPDFDPEDIWDKSKSDNLAKVIVLIQAGWFLTHTIGRLAVDLPLSLFEVNTVGHLFCALIVYILWWNKPREVMEPNILVGDWVHPIATFMYMSSRVSGVGYRQGLRPANWISPELENLTYIEPGAKLTPKQKEDKFVLPMVPKRTAIRFAGSGDGDAAAAGPQDGQTSSAEETPTISNASTQQPKQVDARDNMTVVRDFASASASSSTTVEGGPKRANKGEEIPTAAFQSTPSHVSSDLTGATECEYGDFKTDIRRFDTVNTAKRKRKFGWVTTFYNSDSSSDDDDETTQDSTALRRQRRNLCAEAICKYPAVKDCFQPKFPDNPSGEWIAETHQFVTPVSINWPSDFLLTKVSDQVAGMVLWFSSIIYGSIHIAAWNEWYPSETERFLWHLSASYIAAMGAYWTLLHGLFYIWPWLAAWWEKFIKLRSHWLQYVFFGFVGGAAMLLYVLCRLYLTVEGLVSLRASPTGIYSVDKWTKYVPHCG